MSIRISKNAHLCAACGVDFQHEATITSTVKKAEGVLHREDFCKDCWQSERNKEAYSVWNMVYHDPKIETAEPPEVFSPLRQLFYEAAEEESRVEMAKAFLAAGLLRRQKVFRLIKESDEADGNVRVTLYTDRLGNRLIEVPDPQFTYAELDTARAQLLKRLQELETAAAAAEAAEGADGETSGDSEQETPESVEPGEEQSTTDASEDTQPEADATEEDTEEASEATENGTADPDAEAAEHDSEAAEEEEDSVEVSESGEADPAEPETVAEEESDEVEAEPVAHEEVLHAQA